MSSTETESFELYDYVPVGTRKDMIATLYYESPNKNGITRKVRFTVGMKKFLQLESSKQKTSTVTLNYASSNTKSSDLDTEKKVVFSVKTEDFVSYLCKPESSAQEDSTVKMKYVSPIENHDLNVQHKAQHSGGMEDFLSFECMDDCECWSAKEDPTKNDDFDVQLKAQFSGIMEDFLSFECEADCECWSAKEDSNINKDFNRFLDTFQAPHTCEMCGSGFQSEEHLNSHLKTNHTQRKQFFCQICGKVYTRKGGLDRHLIIHYGKNNYVCEVCDKSFPHKKTMKDHLKAHFRKEDIYVCTVCDRRFDRGSSLRDHRRIHKRVRDCICVHCDEKFPNKNDLLRHARSTYGRKGLICEVCGHQHCTKLQLDEHRSLKHNLRN